MGDSRQRLWTDCTMSEGGIECSGNGAASPLESFMIDANGQAIEVVVTDVETPGPVWRAIDRAQYDRLYRSPDPA